MKKLFKLAAVLLALGVIVSLIGVVIIRRDNVAPASIYSSIENNLKLSEENFEYSEPQQFDLTNVKNKTTDNTAECGLNEFNSLELYGEKCSIQFVKTNSEKMKAALNGGTLVTALSGGKFYIQAIGNSENSRLTVEIPDIFKGGVDLEFTGCTAEIGNIDSAMDLAMNFKDCDISGSGLSADNITLAASGASLRLGTFTAVDKIESTVVSSQLRLNGAFAKNHKMVIDHTNANLRNIEGRWILNANMSNVEAAVRKLSGGITIDLNAGSAVVRLPENARPEIEHSEKYGVFRNNLVEPIHTETADEAIRNIIDCTVQYGVITFEN